MAGVNKVILLGNLGADPEIRTTQNGRTVASLSLATSRQWTDRDSGEKMEETEWHRVTVWGKQAEVCQRYLFKGRQVFIEGRIRTTRVEKDGDTKYYTEVVCDNLQLVGGKPGGEDRSSSTQVSSGKTQTEASDEDW